MYELFHAIGDAESAKVRAFITEHDLLSLLKFRNVHYDEVKADLTARGGTKAPALWDGTTLLLGADAILAKLATLKP